MTQKQIDEIKKKVENAEEIGMTGANVAQAVLEAYCKDIPLLIEHIEQLQTELNGYRATKLTSEDIAKLNRFVGSELEKALFDNQRLKSELQGYKQAEEQGLLVKLPCKVGDVVYWVGVYRGKLRVVEYKVEDITVYSDGYFISCGRTVRFFKDEIGKSVFLTREEAEKALKECEIECCCPK